MATFRMSLPASSRWLLRCAASSRTSLLTMESLPECSSPLGPAATTRNRSIPAATGLLHVDQRSIDPSHSVAPETTAAAATPSASVETVALHLCHPLPLPSTSAAAVASLDLAGTALRHATGLLLFARRPDDAQPMTPTHSTCCALDLRPRDSVRPARQVRTSRARRSWRTGDLNVHDVRRVLALHQLTLAQQHKGMPPPFIKLTASQLDFYRDFTKSV
jgi:hypothetical protein